MRLSTHTFFSCTASRGRVTLALSGLAVFLISVTPFSSSFAQSEFEFNEFIDDTTSSSLTSIEIGPDGRLYGAAFRGDIVRWDLDPVTGQATNQTTVYTTPGSSNTLRQTGITFDPNATAGNLILWSSYATNQGPGFLGRIDRVDLGAAQSQNFISGLPVAGHQNNDLTFGDDGRLYFGVGSSTAAGGDPNLSINELAETPLSAAIVVADVNSASFSPNTNVNPNSGYDATAPVAPVTAFATGVRNAYDVLQHSNGFCIPASTVTILQTPDCQTTQAQLQTNPTWSQVDPTKRFFDSILNTSTATRIRVSAISFRMAATRPVATTGIGRTGVMRWEPSQTLASWLE